LTDDIPATGATKRDGRNVSLRMVISGYSVIVVAVVAFRRACREDQYDRLLKHGPFSSLYVNSFSSSESRGPEAASSHTRALA